MLKKTCRLHKTKGEIHLDREEAIEVICSCITDEIVISANGFISRDLFSTLDKSTNFYMIGSMGLASSIALGVAIKNPKIKVYVFDGDGNILMNLGSLATIGNLKPKNLIHIVFDNNIHETTGGQPTNTKKIHIEKIAKSVNFTVAKISTKQRLVKTIKKIDKMSGPIMLVVQIQKSKKISNRVQIKPNIIHYRFKESINN